MRAMSRRIALAAAMATLVTGIPAAAQPKDEPGRACATADLMGTWEMQGMSVDRSETVDPANALYFRYQRYVFRQDGTVKHVAAPKPPADPKGPAPTPTTSKWKIDQRGWLVIQPPGNAKPQESLCALVTRDMPGPTAPRRGDVLLSYMRDNHPIVQKLLRKAF
jgi:hypothetical protein